MFFLNIWKRIIKNTFIENYLVSMTQGKDRKSIYMRLSPAIEQYKRTDYRNVTRNGIRYRLYPYDYDDYILYYGLEEEPRSRLFDLVKDNTVIFDVGTNIGQVLLTMAKINTQGELHGFEPLPEIYERAKRNIELNPFQNIVLNNVALSNKTEDLTILSGPASHSGSTRLGKLEQEEINKSHINIHAITMDDYVAKQKITNLDLIKIDVEGFEVNVLRGATAALQRFKPILFVEVNDAAQKMQGRSGRELIEFIRKLDYDVFDINMKPFNEVNPDYPDHFDVICKHKLS